MSRTADLIIIGGGLHGSSAALHAAMRGLSVIVLEKDSVGRHASGTNAGGLRRLNRHLAEIPICERSMEIWRNIEALVDDDCGFQQCPHIKVAETEAELETLAVRAATVRNLGFEHEIVLDRADLRRQLPAVADHCVGALATLNDGVAMPYQTTMAFRRKAEALGVHFFEGTKAERVVRTGSDWHVRCGDNQTISGQYLVNCAGAWAGDIARQLGERAPVEAVAPMMLVTGRMPAFCEAVVGATGQPLSFKQMPNGTVVIGGARRGWANPANNSSDIRFDQLYKSAATALAIFPIMRSATIVRSWSGIEALMPDRIPVIGASSTEENAFHAFGFSEHGFQLGPVVGEIISELIANGSTNAPIGPFSIDRFH